MEEKELQEIKIHNDDEENKNQNKIYYDMREILLIFNRFKRLHLDAGRMLIQSQKNSRISLGIKITIIMLGLSTSYVSAVSGIQDDIKTYITTIFSLGSAVLSGLTSIKNFSKDSTNLYTGYSDYIQLATEIEPIFYHFEGSIPYKELIKDIDKMIAKNEGMIEKTKKAIGFASMMKPKYFEKLIFQKIKDNNNGILPDWFSSKDYVKNQDLIQKWFSKKSQSPTSNENEETKE